MRSVDHRRPTPTYLPTAEMSTNRKNDDTISHAVVRNPHVRGEVSVYDEHPHKHIAQESLGYSDELLRAISDKLIGKWFELGICLGLSKKQLDQLNDRKTVAEMGVEMLESWWRARSNHQSKWGELCYALSKIHRSDLLDETHRFFLGKILNNNNPDENAVHDFFRTMSNSLGGEWEDLAFHLGLTSDQIRSIGRIYEQDTSRNGFKVLKLWQAKPDSAHHQLLRVLVEEMSRLDVVRFVLRYLEMEEQERHIVPDGC